MDWEELPSELVQQIAFMLREKDRQALLRTCTTWCAALEAVPELWPVSVLSFDDGSEAAVQFVFRQARQLSRYALRVRLEQPAKKPNGHGRVIPQPYLVLSLLLQLPATVRWVEVTVRSAGAVLAAVRHMHHLSRLELAGNAAQVDWEDRRGTHALCALRTLRLQCQHAPQREEWQELWQRVPQQPDPVPAGAERLRAATQLSSLRLSCLWDGSCADVLGHLTALRDLRLDVLVCKAGAATAAVAVLGRLPSLAALSLSIHACFHTDAEILGDRMDSWKVWVRLPALAPLAAALTHLRLVGAVSLPPDWRHLSRLQCLQVQNAASWAEGRNSAHPRWPAFEWGGDSLSSLTALTKLQVAGDGVLPGPALLATAPRLCQVTAWTSSYTWQEGVKRCIPGVLLNCGPEHSWGAGSGASQQTNSSSWYSSSDEDSGYSTTSTSSSSDSDGWDSEEEIGLGEGSD